MKSKFEALIEHILNDNQEAARELFHDIVVEKSREIYTDLVREESEGSESESEGSEGDEEVKEAVVDEIGGDAADDMQSDIASDEAGMGMDDAADELGAEMGDDMGSEEAGEEMGDEEVEDRIVDLEAALDELKAEFDKLMSDEEASHAEAGASEEMPAEGMVREYKEKAPAPVKSESGANTKSIVAGKNDMGGTTANIAKGGANVDPNGNSAPKAPKSGDMGAVDPREAGKSAFDKKAPAAKTGESGVNAKSTL